MEVEEEILVEYPLTFPYNRLGESRGQYRWFVTVVVVEAEANKLTNYEIIIPKHGIILTESSFEAATMALSTFLLLKRNVCLFSINFIPSCEIFTRCLDDLGGVISCETFGNFRFTEFDKNQFETTVNILVAILVLTIFLG